MTEAKSVSIPEAVRTLAQVVQIRGIRLLKASCETEDPKPGDRIGELQVGLRIGYLRENESRLLRCFVGLDVGATSRAEPTRMIARFSCDYDVGYEVPLERLSALSDSDCELFAGFNGVYTAWPNAPELFQTTSAKMAIPIVTLPIYRVGMFAPPAPAPESTAPDVK